MTLWTQLADHHAAVQHRPILSLFDASRAARFSTRLGEMLFDYSKTNLDESALGLLLDLADQSGVAAKRRDVCRGQDQ